MKNRESQMFPTVTSTLKQQIVFVDKYLINFLDYLLVSIARVVWQFYGQKSLALSYQ